MRTLCESSPLDDSLSSGAPERTTQKEGNGGGGSSDRFDENKVTDSQRDYYPDPIEIPHSTHSLLFTEPVFSLPFAFAVMVMGLALLCLSLAFYNSFEENEPPVNVTTSVRASQYAAIVVALLMEEGEVHSWIMVVFFRRINFDLIRREGYLTPALFQKKSHWVSTCLGGFQGHHFMINFQRLNTENSYSRPFCALSAGTCSFSMWPMSFVKLLWCWTFFTTSWLFSEFIFIFTQHVMLSPLKHQV